MLLRAGGGSPFLKPALTGYKRVDTHSCIKSGTRTSMLGVGLDLTTAGWVAWDITSFFPVIPPTLSYVWIGSEISVKSSGVAATLNGITFAGGDGITVPTPDPIAELRVYEFVATIAGTLIGQFYQAIRFPVDQATLPGSVIIHRFLNFAGGGGQLNTLDLQGYWD
ncbi:MAG: hypothetical protein KGJ13_06360 [Patescibacteria group bacterium]|nr:hypothetical protein [Patescibacteria group bacterium]